MLTIAYLNTAWNVDELFSLYSNICGLREGRGKFFIGVLESPGFFVSKRVGTLVVVVVVVVVAVVVAAAAAAAATSESHL